MQVFLFDDFDAGAFGAVAGFRLQFAVGDESRLGAQAAEFFQGLEFVEGVLGFFVCLEVGGFAFEHEEDVVAQDGNIQFVRLVRVARVFDLDVKRDVLDVRQAGGEVEGVFFEPAAAGVTQAVFVGEGDFPAVSFEQAVAGKEVNEVIECAPVLVLGEGEGFAVLRAAFADDAVQGGNGIGVIFGGAGRALRRWLAVRAARCVVAGCWRRFGSRAGAGSLRF